MRQEEDSLGFQDIPTHTLYGIQTKRALENYQISDLQVSHELIKAYAEIKKASAETNYFFQKIAKDLKEDIISVCDEIINGQHTEAFLLDIFQAGAGTSTNMNLNEVIANRILEKRGYEKGRYDIISPNDHINMSQSTNDTYPSALRVALLQEDNLFETALTSLIEEFEKKSHKFTYIITSARTHMQDAVPITLGQEFGGYALSLRSKLESYQTARKELYFLSLGGTAAGTGLNTYKSYQSKVCEVLSHHTGINFSPHPDMVEGTQSQRQLGDMMTSYKLLSIELIRIMTDLRFLSSGPHTGIAEIQLPAVQPGSSIMPGKINPSILEAAQMVCFRVLGAAQGVEAALMTSQLNLNVWTPYIGYELLFSQKILTNMFSMLSLKCISGITADVARCKKYAYESNGIFTVLNQILGYKKVAELVHKKETSGQSLEELLEQFTDMSPADREKILDPYNLTSL